MGFKLLLLVILCNPVLASPKSRYNINTKDSSFVAFKQQQARQPFISGSARNVILLGESGAGKSTLGKFLLHNPTKDTEHSNGCFSGIYPIKPIIIT